MVVQKTNFSAKAGAIAGRRVAYDLPRYETLNKRPVEINGGDMQPTMCHQLVPALGTSAYTRSPHWEAM